MQSLNANVILGEAAKRAKRVVGLPNGAASLDGLVTPGLAMQASLTSKAIDAFGIAVESLLIKHGKGILEEQFLLNRLASAAIDIYANTVVLSRATRAAKMNFPSAQHEEKLARVWCNEVSTGNSFIFRDRVSHCFTFVQKIVTVSILRNATRRDGNSLNDYPSVVIELASVQGWFVLCTHRLWTGSNST